MIHSSVGRNKPPSQKRRSDVPTKVVEFFSKSDYSDATPISALTEKIINNLEPLQWMEAEKFGVHHSFASLSSYNYLNQHHIENRSAKNTYEQIALPYLKPDHTRRRGQFRNSKGRGEN